MDARSFLDLADELVVGSREAEWRSAASRAYYAAFHVARTLLTRAGFRCPPDGQAHAYLWLRLANAGRAEVQRAGRLLRDLRQARTEADYRLDQPFSEAAAVKAVEDAMDMVQALDDLAAAPASLARVVAAVRDYERDVLQDVTWHQPPP